MIAIVYDENSYHSSSSHKSGERYLSFSITIIVDLSLPHYPPPPPPSLRNILAYLHKHTFHRNEVTFLLMSTRQKRLAGRVVIFEIFALAGWFGVEEFLHDLEGPYKGSGLGT